jgi:hypothetical protein
MWTKAVLRYGNLGKDQRTYFSGFNWIRMKANVPAVCEVAVLDRLRKPRERLRAPLAMWALWTRSLGEGFRDRNQLAQLLPSALLCLKH